MVDWLARGSEMKWKSNINLIELNKINLVDAPDSNNVYKIVMALFFYYQFTGGVCWFRSPFDQQQ